MNLTEALLIISGLTNVVLIVWLFVWDKALDRAQIHIKRLEREAISRWNVRELGDEFAKQQRAERNE